MKVLDNTVSRRVRAAASALMLYDTLHYMFVFVPLYDYRSLRETRASTAKILLLVFFLLDESFFPTLILFNNASACWQPFVKLWIRQIRSSVSAQDDLCCNWTWWAGHIWIKPEPTAGPQRITTNQVCHPFVQRLWVCLHLCMFAGAALSGSVKTIRARADSEACRLEREQLWCITFFF